MKRVAIDCHSSSDSQPDRPSSTRSSPGAPTTTPRGGLKRRCFVAIESPVSVIASSNTFTCPPVANLDNRLVLRPPTRNPKAIALGGKMAGYVRRIYKQFVRHGFFMRTDVENEAYLQATDEDPMGVVATAISILRYEFNADRILAESKPGMHLDLSLQARTTMCAALFISYKAKSEDCWPVSHKMAQRVMFPFVGLVEFPTAHDRAQLPVLLSAEEMRLLTTLPIYSLIDFGVHGSVESELSTLLNIEGGLGISSKSAAGTLSVFGTIHHMCVTNGKCELLEELATIMTLECIGQSFALIGILAMSFATGLNHEAVVRSRYTRSVQLAAREILVHCSKGVNINDCLGELQLSSEVAHLVSDVMIARVIECLHRLLDDSRLV